MNKEIKIIKDLIKLRIAKFKRQRKPRKKNLKRLQKNKLKYKKNFLFILLKLQFFISSKSKNILRFLLYF